MSVQENSKSVGGKCKNDMFGALSSLNHGGENWSFFRLSKLSERGLGNLDRLPFSIRILLESALRNCDNKVVFEQHVAALANWDPKADVSSEIPYIPARVVLQDFTGVPAVVDLASMRAAMQMLGGDANKINPLVPCDLVIDHSVQVDSYGSAQAIGLNEKLEFERNLERYKLLKWAQEAFSNFRVVPPSTGIVHQVNLECLSQVVFQDQNKMLLYPDTCVGTDSHTTMTNGLGVLSWGVGGIEAEAVMLSQPIYMLIPQVVGIKLLGRLPEGVTATDLVLKVTELCRSIGVVGKFVEFFGPGMAELSVADRATISNMAPEQGSTVSFFPVDNATLAYLRLSGREKQASLAEAYYKEQGLFVTDGSPQPTYSAEYELDLSQIEPAVAGPKRPHDRVSLSQVGPKYFDVLQAPVGPKGYGLKKEDLDKSQTFRLAGGEEVTLSHGSVVIAAITSCTNTSNPSVMIGAGLVAKKAVERGLKVPGYVKTSLAPGSRVVTDYLNRAGLSSYLDELGFNVVGYGCTTCIGNSGPLSEEVVKAIEGGDLVVSAVLSGNRNFEGRVSPHTRTNYLCSPPLVVAYALLGTTAKDITKDPIGYDRNQQPVFLADIWPSSAEIEELMTYSVTGEMFQDRYSNVWQGSEAWQKVQSEKSLLFPWDESSTYVQNPPFFEGLQGSAGELQSITKARVLGMFADSVTTDHISPAGSIAKGSPAASFLESAGVARADWNSYGARRGNHLVMMRGTFANVRIRNLLVGDKVGNYTVHHPSGEVLSFFDASERYAQERTPLVILAGKEYGSGSSRDWAAKGPYLLGVKAVIAESYERIHRSNLIGMGVLPLEYVSGESAQTLGLDGTEYYDIALSDDLQAGQEVVVNVMTSSGESFSFTTKNRIDTPVEVEYFREGGILRYVLKGLAA